MTNHHLFFKRMQINCGEFVGVLLILNTIKMDIDSIYNLELALIGKKQDGLLESNLNCTVNENVKAIIEGNHYNVIKSFDETEVALKHLLESCLSNEDAVSLIQKSVVSYVMGNAASSVDHKNLRLFECLVLGVSYFEIYCQANYTGPEMTNSFVEPFIGHDNIHKSSIQQLECDGCYAFSIIFMPQTLLIARAILSVIADPLRLSWRNGIVLDVNGKILKSLTKDTVLAESFSDLIELRSGAWWNARACLMHLRLLQKQSYDHIPTLWKEAQDMFRAVLTHFGGIDAQQLTDDDASLLTGAIYTLHSKGTTTVEQAIIKLEGDLSLGRADAVELGAQAWLEWGLCCHHFEHSDRVSQSNNCVGINI
jgi:hypothetical protein